MIGFNISLTVLLNFDYAPAMKQDQTAYADQSSSSNQSVHKACDKRLKIIHLNYQNMELNSVP